MYLCSASCDGPTPTSQVTAQQVRRVCAQFPRVMDQFKENIQHLQCSAEQLDVKLQEVWQQCSPAKPILPIQPDSNAICLKNLWASKRRLQQLAARSVETPLSICMLQNLPASTRSSLQHLLACWRAVASFQRLNLALRKRSQQARANKLEAQIQEALDADSKGLTHVYKCMNLMRPKQPRRTIHIKSSEGRLQSNASELSTITTYFSQIFDSAEPPVLPQWHVQSPLDISKAELRQAIGSLSSKKALPRFQAPAALWKAGEGTIVDILRSDFQERFAPGEIRMREDWLTSYVALIPKPGKPPHSPANLRPTSLLPAIPRLLARVAAQRLRPYLLQAIEHVPQFAYIQNRQTSDSLDRVISHCRQVRSVVAANRFNPFKPHQSRARFTGGMQLSLDLAKACDKMPCHCLLTSLERISLPEDLISLILYIHDNAMMSFSKGTESSTIRTGSGIRQGWISSTALGGIHVVAV